MHYLTLTLLLLLSSLSYAQGPIIPTDAPIVVYQSEEPYDDIKENLELAITGRGFLISNVLHISDMLNRTAQDTSFEQNVYRKAESLEFCSLVLSYKMVSADPSNLSTCPFNISVYIKKADPDHVYITFRRTYLLGDSKAVQDEVFNLLDGIVQEALE